MARLFCLVLLFSFYLSVPSAQACSVCFGDPDSDLTKGLNAGVLALLIVVSMVLAGFAAFFVFIARRSSKTLPNNDSTV